MYFNTNLSTHPLLHVPPQWLHSTPMFQLTFCHPPNSPFSLNFESSSLTGRELKLKLISVLPDSEGVEPESIRLVCGGKVIQDHVGLEGQGTLIIDGMCWMDSLNWFMRICFCLLGIIDKSKIYISIKKITETTRSINSSASQGRKPENDPMMAPLLKVRRN